MENWEQLCRRLPPQIEKALRMLKTSEAEKLEEIRIYAAAQPEFVIDGAVRRIPVQVDMRQMLAALSAQALYSCERQMAEGYIPLPGGHRAGVCGRMTKEQSGAWRMTDVSAVCIRIGRRIAQSSLPVRPFLLDENGSAQRVLVLGAPGSGKTTLLRDAALWLAETGLHIAVADEREELFAGQQAQGRISVLSGMDKAQAFSLLLRAMAPQVIVSDELGSEADVQAVREMVRCGVGLLVSAHARSMEDAVRRPAIRQLLFEEAFDWYVLLERRAGVGGIYDRHGRKWEGKSAWQAGMQR